VVTAAVRADANGDAGIDISDAIAILSHLFGGGAVHSLDAADGNGDERVDIADAIYVLAYLFGGGPPPPPPFRS
jgi:hypothetical protein